MNGQVQVIFKHYPLPNHKLAKGAAIASLAAAKQGKFWEYHDELWNNMRYLSPAHLKNYAIKVGCNVEEWEKDFNSEEIKNQVEYEADLAVKLGITGTPAFVVENDVSTGWGSLMMIKSDVDRKLKKGYIDKKGFCNYEGYPCNA